MDSVFYALKFVLHIGIISAESESRKHLQPIKSEKRPQLLVKLSVTEFVDHVYLVYILLIIRTFH